MKTKFWNLHVLSVLLLTAVITMSTISCDDDDDDVNPATQRFTVTIQNISTPSTLPIGALPDRTVPLSPGVWATYSATAPGSLFTADQAANLGTERLAEEGMPSVKTNDLQGADWVDEKGEFSAAGGPDSGPAIHQGESATFSFTAGEDDKLQIMTMFGQSNDWFYAFRNGGLDLFNGSTPVEGDFTSELILYDAGTEADEAPGLGLTQKPDHPNTVNVGPADGTNQIQNAVTRHAGWTIPATTSVIRVTIAAEDL